MGPVQVVLTDFERTLVRLFKDDRIEQEFFGEIWDLCAGRGVPIRVLKAAGNSPYSLLAKAHQWKKSRNPILAETMYHAATKIAKRYEMNAAESIRLFDDVQPVLEKWKTESIKIVVVSNNATEAVKRVLKENMVFKEDEEVKEESLIDHVIGREYRSKMVENLKPKPLLLNMALELSGFGADTALLVGDSVDDMRAGQAAKIGFRVGLLEHSTASERQLRKAGAKLVLNRFGDLQDNEEIQRLLHGGDPAGNR